VPDRFAGWETVGVPFVADDLGAWLVGVLADAGRKKLITLVLGTDQQRALRSAATAAVRLTAGELHHDDQEQAEHVALVISRIFKVPVPGAPLGADETVLEALQAGIAGQLAVLDDASLTGTGQSAADVLGVPGTVLAATLTAHLLREIVVRGSRGGPLFPLASQLNDDKIHLQVRRLEGVVDRRADELLEALARLDGARNAVADAASARRRVGKVKVIEPIGRDRQAAEDEKRRAEEFGRRSENDRLDRLAAAISPLLRSLGFGAPSKSLTRIYERYYYFVHSKDSDDGEQRRRMHNESLNILESVRIFPSLTQRALQSIGESVLEGRFDAQPPLRGSVVRRVDQFVILVSLRSLPITRLTRALPQFEVVDPKLKYLHYTEMISVPFERMTDYMHVIAHQHGPYGLQGFTREHLTMTNADLTPIAKHPDRMISIDTRPITPIRFEIQNGRLWVNYRTRDIGTPAGVVPWHIHVLAVDNVRHEIDATERLEAAFTRAAQR
jgi:hypothetical protein